MRRKFGIRDDETGELFSNAIEIHVMELKRLPEEGGSGSLCDWLKMIAAERSDDMEAIAARSPEIKKVYMKVRHLSSDENTRIIIAARDWLTRMVEARKEGVSEGEAKGRAEGEAKGRAEERAEFVRNMLKMNFPMEQITQLTGMTPEAIMAL